MNYEAEMLRKLKAFVEQATLDASYSKDMEISFSGKNSSGRFHIPAYLLRDFLSSIQP